MPGAERGNAWFVPDTDPAELSLTCIVLQNPRTDVRGSGNRQDRIHRRRLHARNPGVRLLSVFRFGPGQIQSDRLVLHAPLVLESDS